MLSLTVNYMYKYGNISFYNIILPLLTMYLISVLNISFTKRAKANVKLHNYCWSKSEMTMQTILKYNPNSVSYPAEQADHYDYD